MNNACWVTCTAEVHLFGISQCGFVPGKIEQRIQIKPSGHLSQNIIKASELAGADDGKRRKKKKGAEGKKVWKRRCVRMNKKRKARRKELFDSAKQNKPSESKAKEWYKRGGHLFCGQQNEGQNKQEWSKPFTLNVMCCVECQRLAMQAIWKKPRKQSIKTFESIWKWHYIVFI